jgi:hypothetical protein
MTDNAYSILAFTELSENPAWKEKLGELAAKIAEADKAKAAAVEAQKIIDRAGQMEDEVVASKPSVQYRGGADCVCAPRAGLSDIPFRRA